MAAGAGLPPDDPRHALRADCSRCEALCCVAPAFAASADFAIDKPAGVPCPRLRDDLGALHRVLEKQTVVFGDGTDADVLGFVDDPLEVAVQIFSVRGGRIRGQRG